MGEMKRLWEGKLEDFEKPATETKLNPHNFYEVKDNEGRGIWGGKSTLEAIKYYRQSRNATVWVGVWDEGEDDAYLLIEPINITSIILSTIANTMDRGN